MPEPRYLHHVNFDGWHEVTPGMLVARMSAQHAGEKIWTRVYLAAEAVEAMAEVDLRAFLRTTLEQMFWRLQYDPIVEDGRVD